MKTILLIDIDSKIPNLALKKVERFYKDRGDAVMWNYPLAKYIADETWVSCVFSKNKHLCDEWVADGARVGGTGYDIGSKLPREIDEVMPHINLGFTTRGCIRHCPFCVVPQKEGNITEVGDLLDLWDGKSSDVVLMDNNILALPNHFHLICSQAKANKIRLDFNQGLDHRLLSQSIIDDIKTIRHKELRFAFDHPSYLNTVDKAITLLQTNGIARCFWYVLVGFNTSIHEDIDRLNYLKGRNQTVFVQRHESHYTVPEYVELARWANQHHIFRGMTLREFVCHPSNQSRHASKVLLDVLDKTP